MPLLLGLLLGGVQRLLNRHLLPQLRAASRENDQARAWKASLCMLLPCCC